MKLNSLVEKLATFEPSGAPFISLYLNAEPGANGRDAYRTWLKNSIRDESENYDEESEEGQAFAATIERLNAFLDGAADEADGIAVFAEVGGDFFETAQLDVAFPENQMFVLDRPHIFPLVRMIDQNPKYCVLWADTNKADIYVFGGENTINVETDTQAKVESIKNTETRRSQAGGWSQQRFQRRIENFHLQHAKETVEEVEKLMRDAKIEYLVLCGDETGVIPLLNEQFSKIIEEKVVSTLNLNQYASEDEIREKTAEVMHVDNAVRDKEIVERMFNAAKSSAGLGTFGVEKTLEALSNGQVEDLLISSDFGVLQYSPKKVKKVLKNYAPGDDNSSTDELPDAKDAGQLADELLVRAINSAAKVHFIEDESLLKEAGGVGAILRYNINATANG
ncbi:MAG TPA: Vms1/Ankzf1 family peptidyl-tRNA hydrolase [Pyrinomonadaceae bacterium]|jgi:peptide subunit release factor 1 (eRF1)